MSPYHTAGLPPRNGPLSSSIGSVATLTTVADEQVDPEECGRVAGWVANFDKLLQDSLGVKCLLVSVALSEMLEWKREGERERGREGGREREKDERKVHVHVRRNRGWGEERKGEKRGKENAHEREGGE